MLSASLQEVLQTRFQVLSDGSGGRFDEAKVAPIMPANADNQYLVRKGRTVYDQYTGNAGAVGGMRGQRPLDSQEFVRLSFKAKRLESNAEFLSEDDIQTYERTGKMDPLEWAIVSAINKVSGYVSDQLYTAVGNLIDSSVTIDLTSSSTNLANQLGVLADSIEETDGLRPNVFAVGQKAATLMATKNDDLKRALGYTSSIAPGAQTGFVRLDDNWAQLKAAFKAVTGFELVVLGRIKRNTSANYARIWTTTAGFVLSAGGEDPSTFKLATAYAEAVPGKLRVGEVPDILGGPGVSVRCDAWLEVLRVSQYSDTSLPDFGRKVTVTLS